MKRRNTLQKSIILDTLRELKNHPGGDMVYEKVQSGEIAKRFIPGSADRFDHICGEHYHVKCIYCDRVMDVDMDYIDHALILREDDPLLPAILDVYEKQGIKNGHPNNIMKGAVFKINIAKLTFTSGVKPCRPLGRFFINKIKKDYNY